MVAAVAQQAGPNVVSKSGELRKLANKTWNLAEKTPMFQRIAKSSTSDKKAQPKVNRLINGHAFRIALSGAAGYATSVLNREAKIYRVEAVKESARAPWLPKISPGAQSVLESFLCAYAAEATHNARIIRKKLGSDEKPFTTRLNSKIMKLAYNSVDKQIFQGAMPTPRASLVTKAPVKTSKKGPRGETQEVDKDPEYKEAAKEADEEEE